MRDSSAVRLQIETKFYKIRKRALLSFQETSRIVEREIRGERQVKRLTQPKTVPAFNSNKKRYQNTDYMRRGSRECPEVLGGMVRIDKDEINNLNIREKVR